MLVCQASTIFPLGTTVGAARTLRAAGMASAVVANAAVRSTVRRVSLVLFILVSVLHLVQPPAKFSA